ncbi:MAG: LLM class flavin-dependent oxidoreductase [Deltaproteobacteria bacterium]|nr:LLM class flavin-dependent oxidoreductase [Deltaproteobacteria bacterium]
MRIGVFVSETWGDPSDLAEVRARARRAEELGFASGWIPYLPWSLDALVALQAAGEATSRIELGTSVIPSYLFHPLALARQASSVREVLGERMSLGIGCSQQVVIEQMHGIPFERPARHIREYVEILRLASQSAGHVGYEGEVFQVNAVFGTPTAKPYPILVGALGPLMLQVDPGGGSGAPHAASRGRVRRWHHCHLVRSGRHRAGHRSRCLQGCRGGAETRATGGCRGRGDGDGCTRRGSGQGP